MKQYKTITTKNPRSSALLLGIDASRAARAHRTGTETYSFELIKALAQLSPPDYRLRLYTPQPPLPGDWPQATNVETRVMPWPRLWTHMRLAAELVQHPPDLLFVPAHVLPVYCPVPALVTVHDLGYRYYPEAHRPFDRRYLDWTTRRHCRLARHIIADSEATKHDLIEFYKADPGKISVVYLGRDESLRRVTNPQVIAETKERYGLSGDYLLYLGTLQPRKNLVRLVEAFGRALNAIPQPDLTLVIAGKRGWLYNDIFKRVEQLGLTGRVRFSGYVADEDKPALLSGALAYLFPSLYEGFGLPVLEAMACGLPVLTGNVSSLPEVAGTAALLVDPHDVAAIAAGIVKLVNDEIYRLHLVEQGYRQVATFSWQSAAIRVLEIVEQIIRQTDEQVVSRSS